MRRLPIVPSLLWTLLTACSGEGGTTPDTPERAPEPSELTLQAVDAGTGAALIDRRLTVRYLVRAPITLDTTAVERVESAEPYRIAHAVSTDSLVVEVRLEAPSYHRVDTVFAVARGGSTGPFTVRMARRLERVAAAGGTTGGRPAGTGGGGAAPAGAPPGTPVNAPSRPVTQPGAARPAAPPPDPDARADRTALRAGDRAFQAGNWVAATTAYQRMPAPRSRTSEYSREYQRGLVRRGISHLNLGERGGALEALEDAVALGSPGYAAYLYLGQAQCGVGRLDDGRQSLAQVERLQSSIPRGDRPAALALLEYSRANCSYGEFELAKSAMDVVRTGSRAVKEFETFITKGEAVRPATPQLSKAIHDARAKVEKIRERVRRGGIG